MADRSIFRKAALERLSSPEQLDRLMQVTDPRGWIALGGLFLMILAGGAWSVLGSIPTTISGRGILLSSTGIQEVESVGTGVVSELRVDVGDRVQAGDTIALVEQPRLSQQVEQARERIRILERTRDRRASFTSTNLRLERERLDQQRADLQRRMEVVNERISWLEQRLASEQEALELGLITPETVQNTRRQLEEARGERVGLELELQNTQLERLMLENDSSRSMSEIESRIQEARGELEALRIEYRQSSRVVSTYAGYVREIRTDVGQIVNAGQAVVSVEEVDAPLQAVVYVPTEGKRIEEGMEARVSPVTVRREEYGFIEGEVVFVSPQPATPQGMRRTLGNEILVQQLSSLGAPFLVRVDLMEDASTPSGFLWSSSEGPPRRVESGTTTTVEVVVEQQRPISLVIPILRRAVGAS